MIGQAQRPRYVLAPREAWPAGLETQLRRIDADCDPVWYRERFEAGELSLLAVEAPGEPGPLCHLLWRQEDEELVLVAGVSERPDHALTARVLPLVEAMAKRRGLTSLRMHTRRWGLAAVAGELGWRLSEITLRKGL